MSDHHTTISMLGVPVPVTVSWRVSSYADGGELEIEGVFSDVLGEITDTVLNSVVGTGYTLGWVPDKGWQDPIRAVLFGQPTMYRSEDDRVKTYAQPIDWPNRVGSARWARQHEPTKPQIGVDGTMYAALYDEIWESQAFIDAVHEGPGDNEGGW